MTHEDLNFMAQSISEAEKCCPLNPGIPRVGAVIVSNGVVIGRGHRGTGAKEDDDHAEMNALNSVTDKRELTKATVYTTLEPCTAGVRSDPLTCCTELLHQSHVKRVVIGILDPNQGVTGKGFWELQSRGIEVQVFPHNLAEQIRVLNQEFVREQRRLGILITNVKDGAVIRTYDKEETYVLRGTFLNPPGPDVFGFVGRGSSWWPQNTLSVTGDEWKSKFYFGAYGSHTLSIVKANELGMVLINYYKKIISQGEARRSAFEKYRSQVDQLDSVLGTRSPAVEMTKPPKGLELQTQIQVEVEDPPYLSL